MSGLCLREGEEEEEVGPEMTEEGTRRRKRSLESHVHETVVPPYRGSSSSRNSGGRRRGRREGRAILKRQAMREKNAVVGFAWDSQEPPRTQLQQTCIVMIPCRKANKILIVRCTKLN